MTPSEAVAPASSEELRDRALTDTWWDLAVALSNPFLSPIWTQAWLETHPEEEPCVLLWRPDGELRGVLPLVRERGNRARLRFVGARRCDWISPACRVEEEAEMVAACDRFLRAEGRWSLLDLDRLDEDSAWPLLCRRDGLAAVRRRRDVLPYIEFGEGGFEEYMAGRSRNFRSQLGRRRRRLERDHGLRFRMTGSPDELEADLDSFFRLHDQRWEKRGGSSSAEPATRDHQRRFAALALDRGALRLWIAEADGEAAAAWYGWRVGERYCYALAGLDERFEPLGLGNVLLAHTIESAAAEGARIYDMMWGDEAYKGRFETGRRYATSWTIGARENPVRIALSAGARIEGRLRELPPRLRDPLASAVRTVRR